MKNFRFITILIIRMFALTCISAQSLNLNDPIPPDPDIRIGKLDNGLTYYIKQNKKPEQRIEMRLAINAGSICETDGQRGWLIFVSICALTERKIFPVIE